MKQSERRTDHSKISYTIKSFVCQYFFNIKHIYESLCRPLFKKAGILNLPIPSQTHCTAACKAPVFLQGIFLRLLILRC